MKDSRRAFPRSAFTLIELLTVIAIIGLLAAILIPTLGAVRDRAHRANDISKLRQMALASLIFASGNQERLPGSLNRVARLPGVIPDGERERWFSTFMVDQGLLPEDDIFWGPSVPYGVGEAGHGYILNNTIRSLPGNFFGRRSTNPSLAAGPRRLPQLRANLSTSPNEETLTQIWMLTNVDGSNYGSASTAGAAFSVPAELRTPWGGRHYAYFDGRVAFVREGSYPSHD